MRALYKIFALALPILLSACNDDDDVTVASDWQNLNQAFVDSLATAYDAQVANPASIAEGDTLYRLATQYTPNTYLYYKKLGVSDGYVGEGATAKFTDTVRVYYKGYLIDGTLFDSNFSGQYPDYELDIPSDFLVSGLQASSSGVIYGWTEILQIMRPAANGVDRKGDMFRVYIPYGQGYGADGSGSIPGYSTLIFDINLVEVNPES